MTTPAEELRKRYDAAIRATWDGTSMHMDDAIRIETDAVMAVRDDELARLTRQAERVRAAVEALEAEAAGFNARHNPDCECEWGDALAEAGRRIRAAMDEPAEAAAAEERFRVEIHDGGQWMPAGSPTQHRQIALDALAARRSLAKKWAADGEPVRWRVVRETTTYTVEATP
jgi:hypothetical protein